MRVNQWIEKYWPSVPARSVDTPSYSIDPDTTYYYHELDNKSIIRRHMKNGQWVSDEEAGRLPDGLVHLDMEGVVFGDAMIEDGPDISVVVPAASADRLQEITAQLEILLEEYDVLAFGEV